MIGAASLAAGPAAIPTTAHAQIPVLCDETSLVTSISMANANGGDTLALAPFCTYTPTSAHGSGTDGPDGLPPITTPINMVGLNTTIPNRGGAVSLVSGSVTGNSAVAGAASTRTTAPSPWRPAASPATPPPSPAAAPTRTPER
ncbi:hypothetical protein [Streptantibioticus ferralitis]|uniref:Uncharacterized protein n=1 Tax=Streptantibioticus ferralitis TaxID=236510 RepID=A0ABT5YVQ7_9ACTN|nr:hypothetical protein [Streptantibioticus ferralitis]MDF2255655.1 hypothetical protein [Streptantibioticus ferralitis]